MPLSRVPVRVPITAVKTYSIRAPLATHTRPGTCEEAGCEAHTYGWRTVVDEATELGARQAHFIRHDRSRRHTEDSDGRMTVFTFEPGQVCFTQHRISLERPELFIVRDGDHRGNPTGRSFTHTRPEHWVEDMQENNNKVRQDREG